MSPEPELLVLAARAARARGDLDVAQRHAAELWVLFERRVAAHVRRKVPATRADDVIGDVTERFLHWLWKGREDPRSVAAMMRTLTARTIADHHRRGTQPGEQLVGELPEPGVEDELIARTGETEWLEAVLGVLGAREREVVEAVALREEPREEVAVRLGVTANNLYQIYFRALRRLEATIGEDGPG